MSDHKNQIKMSQKPKEDKPSTSKFGVCCQASSAISPDNSITEYSAEDDELANNNTLFHTPETDNLALEKIAIVKGINADEFSFPKRPKVDVEFQNLRYTVSKFSFSERKFEKKEILHGVNGAFRSGQLTAIMGPSGAGKSTLLNILAGFVETGVTGKITVNGKNRSSNSKNFRNVSAYIHQDDALRPYLTVREVMTVAAHLKLGFNVTKGYKKKMIESTLTLLGLQKRIDTNTGSLSGGQRKRLAIALELISNPPVIFLDEPTTGLDSSSCTSCISLLKRLAQEGRTIVCTIHQPSALIFEMFDKLYAITQGHCIYQGPTKELVPFMSDHGLQCPSYHNPADFLMEIAVGEYEVDFTRMLAATVKKYYEDRDKHDLEQLQATTESILRSSQHGNCDKNNLTVYEFSNTNNSDDVTMKKFKEIREVKETSDKFRMEKHTETASLLMQFFVLFNRNFKACSRNRFLIFARLCAHLLIAPMFGYLYIGVGGNALTTFGNYVYLYGSILLIVYTGKMSVVLSFPLEMEILKREHFNRWYNLGPYYLSVISFEIPFQIVCAILYVLGSYFLTGNYSEFYRFLYFILFCVMATLCAQAWGFFIGATLPVKIAVFIGPILAVLFSVFGFCTRYKDITPMFSWMWHISYFRAGFHGVLDTSYGMNRSDLFCPDDAPMNYCHFRKPTMFLKEVSITELDSTKDISLMIGVIVTMHILTIIILWFKLNKR